MKVLWFALFVTSFFVFSISVGAQTTSITGTTDSAVTTTKRISPPRPPAIQEQKDLIRKNIRETRDLFKEKLKTIRDERKKALVERIDQKISTMNQTHTARFSAILEKLEAILNRISDRAQKLKEIPAGLNITAVDSDIATAKAAIDAAKTAVAAQAAKTYNIDIVSETTLKTTVGSVVSMFRKDLRDVHKIVIDAKQSVQKAEKELAKVRGEKTGKAGENQSITVTPSVSEK